MGSDFQTVSGLSHVAVRTRSILDSVRYYADILGLKEAFRMYRDDGSLATVYMILAPGQIGFCHICLMTRDIRKSFEAVKEAGGPLDSEVRRGKSNCWMFWTHDPDGTEIEIMEMPPESMQAQANRRLSGRSGIYRLKCRISSFRFCLRS